MRRAISQLCGLFGGARGDAAAGVRARVDAFVAALLKPERSVLEELTSPDLSYGHSNGRIENREEFFLTMLEGHSRFLSIELTAQAIKTSGDIAIARHNLYAHTHDKGKEPGTIRIGIMLVWRRECRSWKLLARQAYRLSQ
ncbi:MAG TPA: nuclear transport factor 2 family protein [Gammaproteobacteria bacterium]|nr:nuclear transport factor 2 family protein [Gammaproteobacteria bacterium]